MNAFNHNRVGGGSGLHHPLFRKCRELAVPLAIHPRFKALAAADGIFDWPRERNVAVPAAMLRL